ncbi:MULTISPECIES: InlB B-repeat-containing protein [Gordonibacter]|uniref:InlB B-repeat-containing protein n=1 Tax=Gordonibacter faecis TaxID=3047475 RepID=A0ABT7DSC2_9ACTN|nr:MULTISPECIES: InlB B-repeat-containing protein [unclassified Gordonibacter]MDJ1651498.1 InlB B-repeat-containing protein [Gordonibacter sp. KGMB12511]HIW76089.1 InlB B-repeat-containing protein [Candidatus Gordonibacter avicola]
MGLHVWNSSKNQSSGTDGQPDSVRVGLRVTNSNSTEPVKVRVTFQGNQGKWEQADSYGVDVALFEQTLPPPTKPERVGYELDGWSTTPNGAAVSLPTSTVEAATYYARWKLNTFTIKYSLGGGTKPGSNPETYDVTQLPKELANAAPPANYKFDGWTCAELSITTPTPNYTIPANTAKDLTFVAHYSRSAYTVTFDSNEGSAVSSQLVVPNGNVTKPSDPTRAGYAFGGWYTDTSCTTPYNFNTSVTTDFTLYAKWNPAYTIVFNSNDGTGSMQPMSMVRGEAKALTVNSFTRTGYKFTSWNTESDGTGTTYTNQQSVDLTVNPGTTVTLYAQWDLVISCEFPTAGVLEIDASGKVTDVTTGGTNTFRSGTVVPLTITEVESTKLGGADSLFANADTSGAKVVLTPPTGQGSVVEVPVATTKTSANFTIPAKEGNTEGQLALKFGLSLPSGMSLTYLPDQYRSIVQLSYAVSVA